MCKRLSWRWSWMNEDHKSIVLSDIQLLLKFSAETGQTRGLVREFYYFNYVTESSVLKRNLILKKSSRQTNEEKFVFVQQRQFTTILELGNKKVQGFNRYPTKYQFQYSFIDFEFQDLIDQLAFAVVAVFNVHPSS
jgi:hypothetical protein